MGICIARSKLATRKERGATAKALRESQALLSATLLFERKRIELWKPEGAAKRPHSNPGWNQSSLAKQWRPNPAEVR
jgi:hypothetical protein